MNSITMNFQQRSKEILGIIGIGKDQSHNTVLDQTVGTSTSILLIEYFSQIELFDERFMLGNLTKVFEDKSFCGKISNLNPHFFGMITKAMKTRYLENVSHTLQLRSA